MNKELLINRMEELEQVCDSLKSHYELCYHKVRSGQHLTDKECELYHEYINACNGVIEIEKQIKRLENNEREALRDLYKKEMAPVWEREQRKIDEEYRQRRLREIAAEKEVSKEKAERAYRENEQHQEWIKSEKCFMDDDWRHRHGYGDYDM